MKIALKLTSDSFNTYPQDSLEFVIGDGSVIITLENDDKPRVISVDKQDFIKLLKVCEM